MDVGIRRESDLCDGVSSGLMKRTVVDSPSSTVNEIGADVDNMRDTGVDTRADVMPVAEGLCGSPMELADIVSNSEVDIGINSVLREAVGSSVITTIEVDSLTTMLGEGGSDIVVMRDPDSLLMLVATDCHVVLVGDGTVLVSTSMVDAIENMPDSCREDEGSNVVVSTSMDTGMEKGTEW